MKKLNLGNLSLSNSDVLSREQLKKVLGGVEATTTHCTDKCTTNADCSTGYSCYNITYPNGDVCKGCVQNEYAALLGH